MNTIELTNGVTATGLRVREILIDLEMKTAEVRYETVTSDGEVLGADRTTVSLTDWNKLDKMVTDLMEKAQTMVQNHAAKKWGKKNGGN